MPERVRSRCAWSILPSGWLLLRRRYGLGQGLGWCDQVSPGADCDVSCFHSTIGYLLARRLQRVSTHGAAWLGAVCRHIRRFAGLSSSITMPAVCNFMPRAILKRTYAVLDFSLALFTTRAAGLSPAFQRCWYVSLLNSRKPSTPWTNESALLFGIPDQQEPCSDASWYGGQRAGHLGCTR